MAGNTLGNIFKFTSFGESHGTAIGGVIDGMPSGLDVDYKLIEQELQRRKPKDDFSTLRNEDDKVKFLSGIFENKTTGTPIAFLIENNNQKSSDYDEIKDKFRPSHGDFSYYKKYCHYDYRGGGRYSARTTVATVVAGAFAKMLLSKLNILIFSGVSAIGKINSDIDFKQIDYSESQKNRFNFTDKNKISEIEKYLQEIKRQGDSVGGVVCCSIKNVSAGVGEPIFKKLNASIAYAIFSINAVKGVEFGAGFNGATLQGSEYNDIITTNSFTSNNDGGIQAGISNGNSIDFRVAFKPVSTIMKPQQTIDKSGNSTIINPKGRHDVCFVPRALPIVEATTAIVLIDNILQFNAYKNWSF